jgi:hypothetical protein
MMDISFNVAPSLHQLVPAGGVPEPFRWHELLPQSTPLMEKFELTVAHSQAQGFVRFKLISLTHSTPQIELLCALTYPMH